MSAAVRRQRQTARSGAASDRALTGTFAELAIRELTVCPEAALRDNRIRAHALQGRADLIGTLHGDWKNRKFPVSSAENQVR